MKTPKCPEIGRNRLSARLCLWLCFVACVVLELGASAAGLGTTLLPIADTYVRSLSRDSRKNYGSEPTIDIRSSSRDGASEGYIAFDVTPFSGAPASARLRLYASLEKTGVAVLQVRSAYSTNWIEKSLTWWESIPHSTPLGRVEITGGSPSWYEVDVTEFVHKEISNRRQWVNFALVYSSESINRIQVRSKESAGYEPQLILTRSLFRAKVQFLPKGSMPADGYLPENGTKFALKEGGLSYGWNQDMTAHVRDRLSTNNTAPQKKLAASRRAPTRVHETFSYVDHDKIKTKAVWEIAVPNGRYSVRVIAGDLVAKDSIYSVNVEDTKVFDVIPEDANRWADGTVLVDVKDGRLTLTDNPNGSHNKVCGIEITEVTK